jgi:hypothetical protein
MLYLMDVYGLVVLVVSVLALVAWGVTSASVIGGRFLVRLYRVTTSKFGYFPNRLKLQSHSNLHPE